MSQREPIRDLSPEEKKALRILSPLFIAFPKAPDDDDVMRVYAIALAGLGEAVLSAGVMRCLRTCKFFPSISEIMDASVIMVEAINGTNDRAADEAWKEVEVQMREAFIYKKPVFSRPEIETAALAMGWQSLCLTPNDQMGTARAQFLRLYESVCNRGKNKRINDNVISLMGGDAQAKQLIGNVASLLPGIKGA